MESVIENKREPQYAELVKTAFITAIENGESVLQKDREGINYSCSAASATAYTGVNQLYLQQIRKDSNFENGKFGQ